MQTILKIVCDKRGLSNMVDDFILRFCAKAAGEAPVVDIPAAQADDVAYVRDDRGEIQSPAQDTGQRADLGSFEMPASHADPGEARTTFIFVNPVILSFRPNKHRLCIWVGPPFPDKTENTDAE